MTVLIPINRTSRFALWSLLLALLLGLTGSTTTSSATFPAALPILGGGGSPGEAPTMFTLEIPSIDVTVPVLEAPVIGDTWDFSPFTQQAAHLQLTAFPGQGSNVVIGAHYELANFVPGPFINLDEVPVGGQILITYHDRVYVYEVSDTMLVTPENIEVAYRTPHEMLTLLTCYDFSSSSGVYTRRYVVRAVLVGIL